MSVVEKKIKILALISIQCMIFNRGARMTSQRSWPHFSAKLKGFEINLFYRNTFTFLSSSLIKYADVSRTTLNPFFFFFFAFSMFNTAYHFDCWAWQCWPTAGLRCHPRWTVGIWNLGPGHLCWAHTHPRLPGAENADDKLEKKKQKNEKMRILVIWFLIETKMCNNKTVKNTDASASCLTFLHKRKCCHRQRRYQKMKQ